MDREIINMYMRYKIMKDMIENMERDWDELDNTINEGWLRVDKNE